MLSQKPWRAEAVIQLFAAVFACMCLGMVVAGLLQQAGIAAFKSPDSFASLLLATLSFQGAAWILILIFLKRHAVPWRDAFGFRDENVKAALATAIKTVLVVLPIAWGIQYLSATVLEKFGWQPENERAVDLIANAGSFWLRVYLGFFAIVLAPVAEEFLFRGTLFPFVKQLGFPKIAWFGVSFLFAAIHLNAPTLVPLLVFALAQTWLYDRTDNLLAPITSHAVFNAANLVVLCVANRALPTHE
jgi:membrane protease YdiL (CAAX protease family)